MNRGLEKKFLDEMRRKLDIGRARGYGGWDRHWKNCTYPLPPSGVHGFFMTRLREEMAELTVAVHERKKDKIREEAADVANFAMFIADYYN